MDGPQHSPGLGSCTCRDVWPEHPPLDEGLCATGGLLSTRAWHSLAAFLPNRMLQPCPWHLGESPCLEEAISFCAVVPEDAGCNDALEYYWPQSLLRAEKQGWEDREVGG